MILFEESETRDDAAALPAAKLPDHEGAVAPGGGSVARAAAPDPEPEPELELVAAEAAGEPAADKAKA